LLVELEETKRLLQFTQQEGHQKSHFIADLNNQIVQMQRHLEDRRTEMENLKKQLQKVYEDMTEIRNLYDEQRRENEFLRKQWHTRFDNQQKRIDAIVEIAKAERGSLLDDVKSLISEKLTHLAKQAILTSFI
jgi:chromosome segregation ATPase